jgi:hypothetical protein
MLVYRKATGFLKVDFLSCYFVEAVYSAEEFFGGVSHIF